MLVCLLSLLGLAAAQTGARLYCYWESAYMQDVADFAHDLVDVPIWQTCDPGCNTVILSYVDYTISFDESGNPLFGYLNDQTASDSTPFDYDHLKAAIDAVHASGGEVFISLGSRYLEAGSSTIKKMKDAKDFIDNLAIALEAYGIDGVDFNHEDSTITIAIMSEMIKRLKDNYPDYKIMYTVPAGGPIEQLWRTVLHNALTRIDFVQLNIYDYTQDDYDGEIDLLKLLSLKVDLSQLVLGMKPGCLEPFNSDYHDSITAIRMARFARLGSFEGIGLWSANRDTDTRTALTDCEYLSGEPAGTFITGISEELYPCLDPV